MENISLFTIHPSRRTNAQGNLRHYQYKYSTAIIPQKNRILAAISLS